ncbi:MAG: sigma-70 family RNA polymerase sigma factor [Clostridiales bacterium]|nr:sigma-70 family RNA polymerase sigma factor [Clostridiales bacterium]
METSVIHFTDKNTNWIMYAYAAANSSANSERIEQMKSILSKAMAGELTEMQRFCITEYYLGEKTQKDIAQEIGKNISTVSRHISAARKKLRHIASYYS